MAYALLLAKTYLNSVSGTVWSFTTFGSTIPAGTLLDIGCGGNLDTRAGSANGKILTCNDNSSQSGNANVYIPVLPSPGGTTAGVMRVRCYTTRAILTGDTITFTMVGGTMSRRSGLLMAFSGASATTQIDKVAIASALAASPISVGPTAALAEANSLAVMMSAWRGGAVASGFANSTAGYTAQAGVSSGGTTPNVEVNGAYKVAAGTAAETDAHTFTSFAAGAGMLVTYRPTGYTETFKAPNFTVVDNFNTGANQSVNARAGWGTGVLRAGDGTWVTDATPTQASGSSLQSNIWGTLLAADQECNFTVGTLADTTYLICRGDTSTGTLAAGYYADIGWSGDCYIKKFNGTVLWNNASVSDVVPRMAAGDSYTFSCIGNTLTLYRRASGSGVWQVLATVNDTSYNSAGYAGIAAESGSTPTATDFGVLDYPAAVAASARQLAATGVGQ